MTFPMLEATLALPVLNAESCHVPSKMRHYTVFAVALRRAQKGVLVLLYNSLFCKVRYFDALP